MYPPDEDKPTFMMKELIFVIKSCC